MDTTIGDEDGSGPAETFNVIRLKVFSGRYCNMDMLATHSLDFRYIFSDVKGVTLDLFSCNIGHINGITYNFPKQIFLPAGGIQLILLHSEP